MKILPKDAEVETYNGKVMRIMNFGAFVEILPGKEGLVPISKLAHEYVNKVEDVVKVGDEITVKVTDIDDQGRINLSRKATLPPPEGQKSSDDNRRGKNRNDRTKGKSFRKDSRRN